MHLSDLVLSWRIRDIMLEFTVSSDKIHTAAEQRVGFLATQQHSLDRTCASLQGIQE